MTYFQYFSHTSSHHMLQKVDEAMVSEAPAPPASVVRVLSNGRYASGPSETSDSTDNEEQDKRRRFKKRYELDRNKSSSMHNLPSTAKFSLPPESGPYDSLEGHRIDSRLHSSNINPTRPSSFNHDSHNVHSDKTKNTSSFSAPKYSENQSEKPEGKDIYSVVSKPKRGGGGEEFKRMDNRELFHNKDSKSSYHREASNHTDSAKSQSSMMNSSNFSPSGPDYRLSQSLNYGQRGREGQRSLLPAPPPLPPRAPSLNHSSSGSSSHSPSSFVNNGRESQTGVMDNLRPPSSVTSDVQVNVFVDF